MVEKDLGLIDFEEFLKIQDKIWKKRVEDVIPDTLVFAEHPVIFSLGARSTKDQLRHFLTWPESLAELGIKIVETKRGGNVTVHAPGILGIYPIVKVAKPFDGIKLVDFLETVIIAVLDDCGINAGRDPSVNRGVWVENRKIASVGIQISGLVSKFGVNLNVSPRLKWFRHINPCGIPGCKVTSMKKELGRAPSMSEIKQMILYNANLFIRI